jgi:hypothetical protein
MAAAVGSNSCLATGVESVFGTPVAMTRWFEFLSENLERRNNIITSNGIRCAAGRNLRRGSRRVISSRDGGGSITMEVATTGFGRWFEHLLGGTPGIVGGAPPYTHTYALGNLAGKSLTIQKVLRDTASTEIEAFNFHGCKILSGEFSISVDQILQLAVEIDAEDVDTSTAGAAASYTNPTLFNFQGGTLNVAGAPVASVTDASIKITNNLKTDRYYLGSAGLKAEPIDNDFPTVDGSLSAEFISSATFYDRFAADSAALLSLVFTSGTSSLTISVPEVRFTGGTPTVGGPDVVVADVPFEGQYDGTNAGITITYVTADATT